MRADGASGRKVFVSIRHFVQRDDHALTRVRVADDLIFDTVQVKKIKTAAWFIAGMTEGPETSSYHACLRGVEVYAAANYHSVSVTLGVEFPQQTSV